MRTNHRVATIALPLLGLAFVSRRGHAVRSWGLDNLFIGRARCDCRAGRHCSVRRGVAVRRAPVVRRGVVVVHGE